MRSILAVLVIVALLAIWLVAQNPSDPQQSTQQTGHELTPDPSFPEPALPVAEQEAPLEPVLDEVAPSAALVAAASESDAIGSSSMRIDFDSDQRSMIVEYLSESGLSEVDGERIADSALNGARECLVQAFGDDNGGSADRIESCMFNVFAAHGLGALQ